jgi:hypothetical protein
MSFDPETNTFDLGNGYQLVNIHPVTECKDRRCVIHSPSKQSWSQHWRDDRGIFERICPHGVGHPDPDQFDYWNETDRMYEAVHGCDGCCRKEV